MRPNLSLENFAAILATLGATALAGCGGSTPQPVHANEVPAAAGAPTGQASCSANGCGAHKAGGGDTSTAAAPAAPASPASNAAAMTAPAASATPAPAATDSSATAATAAPAASAAPAAAKPAKAAAAPKKKPAAAGEASCGAGTCSGDSKKKIL